MSKRIISMLITIVMVFSLVGVLPAITAGALTYSDYKYEILDDGTVEITDYTGSETELEIPSEIDGKNVTNIGDKAFYGCGTLTSVTIPNSVKSIGRAVFAFCTNLTSVITGDGITNIGDSAFGICDKLASITFGNSVINIGENAFENCNNLTSIVIPDSVKNIGESAFSGCENLRSVIIGNGVTSIGLGAFEYCENLTNVTIPNSVTNIGGHAFYGTPWLENKQKENPLIVVNGILIDGNYSGDLTIPDSVKSIGESAFSGCENLRSVIIGNGVTSIGLGAFESCERLTSITIGNSVTSIGQFAFNSSSLKEINVDLNNTTYSSQDGVLFNYNKTELIQYPKGKIQTTYSIPNSVTNIEDRAFYGSNNLNNIIIPKSVTSIGDIAFFECIGLINVIIPDSVTSIGKSAFSGCESLTSITIPDSVTAIGENAFFDCYNLKNVTIPKTVSNIGRSAFGFYFKNISDYGFVECQSIVINFKIYCYSGTAGEQYAKDNEFNYELLDGNNSSQNTTNNSNNNLTNSSQNPNNNQSNKPNNNTNKLNPTTAPTTSKSTAIKKAKIKNINAKAKGKKITVSWKKIKNAKGYQVQAATKKKFKKKQIVFDKKTKKKNITIKGNKIKKNRIYYIRVRAYTTSKNADGKPKYTYSKWTKKKVKTN